MATKGSASNLAVLALICFHVDLVASKSCDQSFCPSIDNCINVNKAMLKFSNRFQTSLSDTAYSYLKTITSKDSDVMSSLSSYWSTFSAFDAKFRAFKSTASYSVYASSTSQRKTANSYRNKLIKVLTEIRNTLPTIPTDVATDDTVTQMTDLYAETNFVSRQFKALLQSWWRCSKCPELNRKNSKKEKTIAAKKPNKAMKGKGKTREKARGKNKKKQ